MKKLIIALFAIVASVTLSSFIISNYHENTNEKGVGFQYYDKVIGWVSATESYTYSVYYEVVDGGRYYYLQPAYTDSEYWLVSNNKYYNNSDCRDYRKNFPYVANRTYFKCNLPYMK